MEMEELKMPSKSKKQARTMRAAAHNPDFAEKMGIPQKVAKEFTRADKRKKGQTVDLTKKRKKRGKGKK